MCVRDCMQIFSQERERVCVKGQTGKSKANVSYENSFRMHTPPMGGRRGEAEAGRETK